VNKRHHASGLAPCGFLQLGFWVKKKTQPSDALAKKNWDFPTLDDNNQLEYT
jgi:hypothetical protein